MLADVRREQELWQDIAQAVAYASVELHHADLPPGPRLRMLMAYHRAAITAMFVHDVGKKGKGN